MTVSYSLDVSKARFYGLSKLLWRWRGSIYKILWKEFLVFCLAYAIVSLTYRCLLNPHQKDTFEKVVVFADAFTDFIPLSFVLGFYVSLVVGRWWSQYEVIPWPDRVAFKIAAYVHGSDDRSRKIRRTLGRYLVLLQVFTFQTVSTAVKRRFPTNKHLVDAGIMTKEEQSVLEKLSFAYGKYWVPCHWFSALAMRAKKEGRIKDSILLEGLMTEILDFRTNCAIMIGYDWISVPLVYTQVVTIATYLYSAALLIGRQYLDPAKGYNKYQVDLYIPVFTCLQFFFYVGWLKVAEQILNPYGEDDDDFELNWCLDRTVNVVNLIVDELQMKHPKVKQDPFWGETEIRLPQTKHSAKCIKNPQLGSAFQLYVEEAEYLPMEELYEEDSAENMYKESIKRKGAERQNSSFISRVLHSGFGHSSKKKSRKGTVRKTFSTTQGCSNPAFSMSDEAGEAGIINDSPGTNKRSSLRKLVKKISPSSNRSSASFRSNSMVKGRQKSYDIQEAEKFQLPNGASVEAASESAKMTPVTRTVSAPAVSFTTESIEREDSGDSDLEATSEDKGLDNLMPAIPEEFSRANSIASIELRAAAQRGERGTSQQMDRVYDLMKEASEALHEMTRCTAVQERWKENEGKGYESCCSSSSSKDSEDNAEEDGSAVHSETNQHEVSVVIEEKPENKGS